MPYTASSFVANEQPSTAKWNLLWANDAYFDSLIGTGTAWTSWTPTWTNLTIGSATQLCAYQKFGKTVLARMLVTFAANTVVGTDPTFTLPATSVSSGYSAGAVSVLGTGIYAGSGSYNINVNWTSTTTATLAVIATGGTYASINSITAANPMAYANTYKLASTFAFEAA